MKTFALFFLTIIFLACRYTVKNTQQTEDVKDKPGTTAMEGEKDTSQAKDTVVIIYAEGVDTLSYSRGELKKVLEYYPELNDSAVRNPDEAYWQKTPWKDIKEKDRDIVQTFDSEAGRDDYFLLYGYFLKQKNGIKQYDTLRKKLVEIYRKINDIHAYLNNGGTYFNHQYKRIVGYAEYGVYLYRLNKEDYLKSYNIESQKKLFIAFLQQYILDEVTGNNGNGLKPADKKEKIKTLTKLTDTVNSLVTDYFLLKQAQIFTFTYY